MLSDEPVTFSRDGEIVSTRELHVCLLPKALSIVVGEAYEPDPDSDANADTDTDTNANVDADTDPDTDGTETKEVGSTGQVREVEEVDTGTDADRPT